MTTGTEPPLQHQLGLVLKTFDSNVKSVNALMHFDRLVVQFARHQISVVDSKLEGLHEYSGARSVAKHAIKALDNVQANDSLRPQYRQMLNQCNVLLVSYFSGAAGDIFRTAINAAVRDGTRPAVLKEEIKIGLRDVREIGQELPDRAGELLAAHRDISFQDMQSIGRAFREYFEHDPARDAVVNDIIVSQACRHVLVHAGGVVDRKMVNQLRNANPRTLKNEPLKEGEAVQFSEAEIACVSSQMRVYLEVLVGGVTSACIPNVDSSEIESM